MSTGPFNPRNLGLLAGILITALIYFPLNHGVSQAHILAGPIDAGLPLVPVLAVPYLILLPVFWLTVLYAWLAGKDFIKLAVVLIIVFGASDLLFAVFPTFMPRPQHVTGIFGGLVQFIYRHDRPFNDLPSEHAAMAMLLVLYFWNLRWRPRAMVMVFALLVIAATVLIKQHSVLGMTGGTMLALIVWFGLGSLGQRTRLFHN